MNGELNGTMDSSNSSLESDIVQLNHVPLHDKKASLDEESNSIIQLDSSEDSSFKRDNDDLGESDSSENIRLRLDTDSSNDCPAGGIILKLEAGIAAQQIALANNPEDVDLMDELELEMSKEGLSMDYNYSNVEDFAVRDSDQEDEGHGHGHGFHCGHMRQKKPINKENDKDGTSKETSVIQPSKDNGVENEDSRKETSLEILDGNSSYGSDVQEVPVDIPEPIIVADDSNTANTDSTIANSNESEIESKIGSETKSDSTEQQILTAINNKATNGDAEQEINKNTSHDEPQIVDINSDNDLDSEEDSSDDESEIIAEDTVSINSDSDHAGTEESSQENPMKKKINDIIMSENDAHSRHGDSIGSSSPEVQEIVSDNDDCVVANEEEEEEEPKDNTKTSDNKVPLRRSSRAIKRKRYNDDVENGDNESDVEEVSDAPFFRRNKTIVINDTKALVEMARQSKVNQSNSQKKEPTVVIIDTNAIGVEKASGPPKQVNLPSTASLSSQNLYQSIVARGTTVTPISVKTSVGTQSSNSPQSSSPQPSILPSLTDDMFVVEAPSFIVPYVYEKPSVKPFREFVDTLGRQIEEQKAKEDKEKERKDKEKRDADKSGKKEEALKAKEGSSEDASSSAKDSTSAKADTGEETEEKKKKKKDKRKRGAEDDDVSWDGETSTDSEDEILSDEEDKTIIIKDKVDAIEEMKDVSDLTAEKVCSNKSDNYFDCSLGKFFINIGLSLVQEYVQSDLLKQQNRKLHREKKQGHNTKSTETSIASLMKNIEFSKENNAPYAFTQQKCEFCSFKTESKLVMAHHLETPHMKNNVYKCNFCTYEIRSPHDILYHMEAEHNIRGKLERAPAYHQCANCPFEDNGKGKLARHLIPCAKKFKPDLNLAPPLEWEPPAKIPKIARSRNNMMGSYQNSFNRGQMGNNLGRPALNVASMMPGVSSSYRARGRSPMAVPPRAAPVHGAPILRGGVMVRQNSPVVMSSNYTVANNSKKTVHQPSISITPLPRQPQPAQQQASHNSKSTFVICEICDGYIKDLEQLRNHMQWIHKVKIHPKMIYNRPPLNCQKCQFRFFTDQGLERHLLGSHGLVTSSMQEAANKGKDAGRCPVCGRVYQWKLLNHVARDHNLTLKPAHLSYKCTVCTATFGMYKQFENHVYSAHSVVAKRVMDKGKSTSSNAKSSTDSLLKPLKINDEITIIPQPVKTPAAVNKDE
ncbi:uncharacterized protein LOC142986109 [Anticarsia gemmatalis]|uniref:uncharacterized protein LOC142986109 n=1 Tax=Anticarsia gemmatalis TaxID=129554 RepID=UPI003F769C60